MSDGKTDVRESDRPRGWSLPWLWLDLADFLLENLRLASAYTVAEFTKVARRYLSRVLLDLFVADLVLSRCGPRGGYELARPTNQITILDVVNAVAPLQRIRSCPLGLETHISLCPLHAELDRAYEATENAFANITMKQLLDSTSPNVPLCNALGE